MIPQRLDVLAVYIQAHFLLLINPNNEGRAQTRRVPWVQWTRKWGDKSADGWQPYGSKTGSNSAGGWKPWTTRPPWKPYGDKSAAGAGGGSPGTWKQYGDNAGSGQGGGWKSWQTKSPSGWKPYGDNAGSSQGGGWKPYSDRSREGPQGGRKPYGDKSGSGYRPYGDRSRGGPGGSNQLYGDKSGGSHGRGGGYQPYGDKSSGDPGGGYQPYGSRSSCGSGGGYSPYEKRSNGSSGGYQPYGSRSGGVSGSGYQPHEERQSGGSSGGYQPYGSRSGGSSGSGYQPYEEKHSSGSNGGYQPYGGRSGGGSGSGYQPYEERQSGGSSGGYHPYGDRSSGGSGSGYPSYGGRSGGQYQPSGERSGGGGWKSYNDRSAAAGWKQPHVKNSWTKAPWEAYTRKSYSSKTLTTAKSLTTVERGPGDPKVKRAFEKAEIVPSIIPKAPLRELKLKYVDTVISFGNMIKANITRLAPTFVRWPIDEANHLHTLIMIDPDCPSRKDPWKGEWQHWIVVNIPWGRVWAGEELTEYRGIKECHGLDIHRYIFLMYHQPKNEIIHFTEPKLGLPPYDMERSHFSTRKFALKYNLGDPVAGNFFTAKWEPYEDILHPYSPFHNYTIHEKDVMNEFEHRYTVAHVDHAKNYTHQNLEITTEEPDDFDMLEHIKKL